MKRNGAFQYCKYFLIILCHLGNVLLGLAQCILDFMRYVIFSSGFETPLVEVLD